MLVLDGADNALRWPVHAVRDAAVLVAVRLLVMLVVLVLLVVPLVVLVLLVMLVVLQATVKSAQKWAHDRGQLFPDSKISSPKSPCNTGACNDAHRRQHTALSWQAGSSGRACHVQRGSHACIIHQYVLRVSDRLRSVCFSKTQIALIVLAHIRTCVSKHRCSLL